VVFPPIGTQAEGAKKLGELLEKHTNGRIKMAFYPSAQLGDKLPTMEALRAGTIEMTESAATDLSNYSKLWSVFSLPYLFDNGTQAIKVLTDPEVRAITEADAAAQGFIIIAWCNLGERSIINTKRPVNGPADLRGLRIRVMQDPVLSGAISAMGAAGTPMAWSEVYPALQQGIIDGLENSNPVITANKMQEVAKYLSLTQQFIIPDPVFVSKVVMDKLPADLQKQVREAGAAAEKAWNEEIWPGAEQKQLEVLKAAGVKVNEVDKAPFKAAVKPVVERFLANADPQAKKLYETIQRVKAKY
jgi:tripartite ATP-independent transporter DctP family solute receptor